MNNLKAELGRLEKQGLLRELEPVAGIDFASNDYLGFSSHEGIRLGLISFLEGGGALGSTGSRLISGESAHIAFVEDELRCAFGSESALLFGSGYMANLGVLVALGGEGVEFFSDRLNHASLIDGMRMARGSISVFAHNDLDQLESLLLASPAARKVIVTESVFSMDGDQAPLGEILKLAERFDAYVVIDEAHGTGACGASGLGLLQGLVFDSERILAIHTCGKALGAYGAFVTCSAKLRALLINRARTFIYTTALSPLAVEHIRLSLRQLLVEPERVLKLQMNGRALAQVLDLPRSHILPLIVGGNKQVMAAAEHLRARGFFVKGIRSPTVPMGQERLRLTASAVHSTEDISALGEAWKEWRDEYFRSGH